jgi:hypothetical protein
LARLGWAGVIGYASGFLEPAASHLPASRFPRNEGLLGQTLGRPAHFSMNDRLGGLRLDVIQSLPESLETI